MRLRSPHPRARATATLVAIAGTMIAGHPAVIAGVWFAVLIPLLVASGAMKRHLAFLAGAIAPLTLVTVVIWGWIVAAPPGMPLGSAPLEGVRFALLIGVRLAVLGGILQLAMLTIRSDELARTLSSCGVRGDAMVATLGAFVLPPELRLRAEQVVVARHARGLMRTRTPLNRLKQLPQILRPLFVWVLRSSVQRADSWQQRQLLSRLLETSALRVRFSAAASVTYVGLAAGWLVVAIVQRLVAP